MRHIYSSFVSSCPFLSWFRFEDDGDFQELWRHISAGSISQRKRTKTVMAKERVDSLVFFLVRKGLS